MLNEDFRLQIANLCSSQLNLINVFETEESG
jgi:hypothetical protein